MTEARVDQLVRAVLEGQSPGYLASPHASAFVAVGLGDPDVVEASLQRLAAAGACERAETKLVYLDAGKKVDERVVDDGWVAAGAAPPAVVEVDVTPPEPEPEPDPGPTVAERVAQVLAAAPELGDETRAKLLQALADK